MEHCHHVHLQVWVCVFVCVFVCVAYHKHTYIYTVLVCILPRSVCIWKEGVNLLNSCPEVIEVSHTQAHKHADTHILGDTKVELWLINVQM
jgi:hypothetical protein